MGEAIVVKPAIAAQFQAVMERGRILFLSAPCGFGKSTLAELLLTGYPVLRLRAEKPDFPLAESDSAWQVLLIDDLQLMQEEADWLALCDLVRRCPERRFVLLSRGAPPGCLMAFQYVGLMTVLHADDLLFDREDIRRLFQLREVPVTDSELTGILKESIGYPLGVEITARKMSAGRRFGPDIVSESFREVFFYFETAIFRRFDLPMRRFLLELAPFEPFDLDLARVVSGDPHASDLLDWLQRNTTMLRYDDIQRVHFWPQFRAFLIWEMNRAYSEEKRRALFSRGGLYYELKEDYPRALDCYTRGGDHAKVSELLIRSADLQSVLGQYSALERYYRSLPETELLSSPALMQGMSVLCALELDVDASEHWYRALEDFAQRCDKQDAAGKQARSRLAWLDIALPQRSVERLTETIPAVFDLVREKEVTLPPFSVTGGQPSVLNGSKDFSRWTDAPLEALRVPLETVLGRDGVGVVDCGTAEGRFERGEDISGRMLLLIAKMNEIHRNGTPDMEFAVNALLARSQLADGQPEDARRTLESLRNRLTAHPQLLANLDAMLCRVALRTGDLDGADAWYRTHAPRNPMQFDGMKRYQYLTQAMVELADGKPDAACQTLAPMQPYCTLFDRTIDRIHLHVLGAIARYRKKEEPWREELAEALRLAAECRLIRTVSGYGSAVLPLLEAGRWGMDAKWQKRLMADVRAQAAYYPLFLQPRLSPSEMLTATELQILHLICADKSNAEIGQIMDSKLPTVKTHVSHILDKLGVHRRSEAKTAARKLRLISDRL